MNVLRPGRLAAPRPWALPLVMVALAACSEAVGPDPAPVQDVWQPLGSGIRGTPLVFFEWEGMLAAGGTFRTAGDQPARNIALWDGSHWHPLGLGLDGPVQDLTSFDGDLVAAGFFGADQSRVFRWNGERWQPMGNFSGSGIMALAIHDDILYAGGANLSRWDGSAWHSLEVEVDGEVHAAGRPFVAHGGALIVGVGSDRLARRDGETWTWMDRPPGVHDLVSGDGALYGLAGAYYRWAGSGWEELPPTPTRFSRTVHGGTLVLGLVTLHGARVVRWDGSAWAQLPGEMDDRVTALGSFDGALVAGGPFTSIDDEPLQGAATMYPAWAAGPGGS